MAPSFGNDESLYDFVVKKGNGVKGLVDSGISEVPKLFIQPPKERIDKSKARPFGQSPIDLSKFDGVEHGKVVEAIGKASETLGFFQVVNHGVPVEVLDSVIEASHKFFNQPVEKKACYLRGASQSPLVKYGTSFAPDIEKVWQWRDFVGMTYTNDAEALEQWPEDLRKVSLEYLKSSADLVRKLMDALMEYLGVKLDESRIEGLTGLQRVNISFYPPSPNPELTIGMSRHSDIGTLAILLQDTVGGLYVRIEDDVSTCDEEEWVEIPPTPGALVINVGDVLQVLSNGRYRSAEHRVRAASTKARVSVPIFIAPRATEKMAPLPEQVESDGIPHYREVMFGDYVNHCFEGKGTGKQSIDFVRTNEA